MKAELPPLIAVLNVECMEIDAFSYAVEELTLHGYDRQQSTDAHIYLIVHEIEPPPAPLCRRLRVTYPRIEHDGEIELNFDVVSFMQFGSEVIFKCEARDSDLQAKLLRILARPVLEVQQAIDD